MLNTATTTMLTVVGLAFALACLAGWTVWLAARVRTERIRRDSEVRRLLLQKIEEKDSLEMFLENDGRLLLDDRERDLKHSAIVSTGRAALFFLVGLGFVVVGLIFPRFDAAEVAGILLISAGIGLALSAFIVRRMTETTELGGRSEDRDR